jgi:hypothetical protein
MNVALWIIQLLLALLFLFAGVVKLALPIRRWPSKSICRARFYSSSTLSSRWAWSNPPGLFRIRPGLTPLAIGLVIIMIGAIVLALKNGPVHPPCSRWLRGLLVFVAYGRWQLAHFATMTKCWLGKGV